MLTSERRRPKPREEQLDGGVDQPVLVDSHCGYRVGVLLPHELEHEARDEDSSTHIAIRVGPKLSPFLSFIHQLADERPKTYRSIVQPTVVHVRHLMRDVPQEQRQKMPSPLVPADEHLPDEEADTC